MPVHPNRGTSADNQNANTQSPSISTRERKDWQHELLKKKQSLNAIRPEGGDRYRHAVLWIDGDLPEDINMSMPLVEACGLRVQQAITVPLKAGGHHVHFIFDDSLEEGPKEGLHTLYRELRDTKQLLDLIPRRILPTINVPTLPGENGLLENFLAWIYLLHWLGHDTGNSVFKSRLEFLRSKSALSMRTQFTEWHECSVLPNFDPVPLLTLTDSSNRGINDWKLEHLAKRKPLPQIIAASLSKPIWYASVNAVDLILRLHQFNRVTGTTERAINDARKPANVRRESDLAVLFRVIHGHALKVRGDPLATTLTWKQLQERLPQVPKPWCQSKISRVMAELLGAPGDKGMTAYKAVFSEDNPAMGFMRYDPDGGRTVDGIVAQRSMFDESPDEESENDQE